MELIQAHNSVVTSIQNKTGITNVKYLGFSATPGQGDVAYVKLDSVEDGQNQAWSIAIYRVVILLNGEDYESLNNQAHSMADLVLASYSLLSRQCLPAGINLKLSSPIAVTDPIGFTEDDIYSTASSLQVGLAFELTALVPRT
jgi:hypothetical protein